MKIHEVENMNADELKAGQAEIVKALDGNAELAVRYVQARLDAKIRDVKLAEQAALLADLQDGFIAIREKLAVAGQETEAMRAGKQDALAEVFKQAEVMAVLEQEYNQDTDKLEEQVKALRSTLFDAHDRGDKMRDQAVKAIKALTTVKVETQSALATVQAVVAETLTLEELESADQGE